MIWVVLAALALVPLAGLARRRHDFFPAPRSGQVTISGTGVEGVKKLSKEKKAALNAASAMLR